MKDEYTSYGSIVDTMKSVKNCKRFRWYESIVPRVAHQFPFVVTTSKSVSSHCVPLSLQGQCHVTSTRHTPASPWRSNQCCPSIVSVTIIKSERCVVSISTPFMICIYIYRISYTSLTCLVSCLPWLWYPKVNVFTHFTPVFLVFKTDIFISRLPVPHPRLGRGDHTLGRLSVNQLRAYHSYFLLKRYA